MVYLTGLYPARTDLCPIRTGLRPIGTGLCPIRGSLCPMATASALLCPTQVLLTLLAHCQISSKVASGHDRLHSVLLRFQCAPAACYAPPLMECVDLFY